MKRCKYQGSPIIDDEIGAKIALAGRLRRDKGEQGYYWCRRGRHYHLSRRPVEVH